MDPSGETMPTDKRSPPLEGTTRHPDPPFSTVLPHDPLNPEEGLAARHTMDVDADASRPIESIEDIQPEAKRPRFQRPGPMFEPLPEMKMIAYENRNRLRPHITDMSEIARLLHRGQCIAQALLEQGRRLDELAMESADNKVLSEETEEIAEIPSGQEQDASLEGLTSIERERMEVKKFFENALLDENGQPRKTQYSRYFQDDALLEPPSKGHAAPNPKDVGHLSEIPSQPLQEGPRSNEPEYCMSDEFIELLDRRAKRCFAERNELCRKEIVANGFKYMAEEALLAFRNYIAENDLFEDDDFKFGEVLHHSFSIEGYGNVYCHYNFTVEIKKNNEEGWSSSLYFAEAKQKHGLKYYFCSPLEATDDGCCYSCKNQGDSMLKHPSGGGYHKGHEGSGSYYPNADSSDDECA